MEVVTLIETIMKIGIAAAFLVAAGLGLHECYKSSGLVLAVPIGIPIILSVGGIIVALLGCDISKIFSRRKNT